MDSENRAHMKKIRYFMDDPYVSDSIFRNLIYAGILPGNYFPEGLIGGNCRIYV
jgi:hypothetical protein